MLKTICILPPWLIVILIPLHNPVYATIVKIWDTLFSVVQLPIDCKWQPSPIIPNCSTHNGISLCKTIQLSMVDKIHASFICYSYGSSIISSGVIFYTELGRSSLPIGIPLVLLQELHHFHRRLR